MLFIVAIPCFLLVVAVGLYLLARDAEEAWLRRLGAGLLLYGVVFALLIVQQSMLTWWLVAISLIMVAVDSVIAQRKIVEMGESFWPDLVRNVLGALVVALIFALPIVIVIVAATGVSAAMISMLLTTTVLAMTTQIFTSPLQHLFDTFAFAGRTELQKSRATLRETADALARNDETKMLIGLDEQEFARFTRRALSHLGDLPKLAASPLIRLPAIDTHLQQQGVDNTLARAAVLRDLLVESILHLKPDVGSESDIAFDSSDAWRHYNALYFPYVVGLKPYSRRAFHDNLDQPGQQALEWFRSQVPERTLYNWQNAAAKLVAQHLQEL